MQIRELLKNNKISLRTYNICMEQQWHSSEDIRNYYNEYKHFDGIKNCGKRSMEELMRISSSDFFVASSSASFIFFLEKIVANKLILLFSRFSKIVF